MKTIKRIIFLTALIFIGSINVSAYDCTNYGCTTCTYKSGDQTYTVSARANGNDNISIKLEKSKKSSFGNDVLINEFKDSEFVTGNKVKCPKAINVRIETVRMTTNNYHFSIGTQIKLSKEDNNGKPIKLKYSNAKECNYDAEVIEGLHAFIPTITVKTDGKEHLEYFFNHGTWSIDRKVTKLKPSDFSGSKCPTLFATCYTDNNKYSLCNLTKNKRLNKDGKEVDSGGKIVDENDTSSGDGNKKTIKPVKPGIKVDIKINGEGCGILGDDLTEWLQWLLDVIRIGGLVLAVVLGIADYMSATFASNEEGMGVANKNFSTRLLCLAILFLVPTLVEFLLTLLNIGVTATNPTCGLK